MKKYNLLSALFLGGVMITSVRAETCNDKVVDRVIEHYENLSRKDICDAMGLNGTFLDRSAEKNEIEGVRGIINADEIETLYNFEKETLIFEQELLEKLENVGLLSSGGPDLIADLNRIDILLFGGRANDFPHAKYATIAGPVLGDMKNFSFANPNGLTSVGELDEDLTASVSALGAKTQKLKDDATFLQKSWQDGFVQNLPCSGMVKKSTVLNMVGAGVYQQASRTLFKPAGLIGGGFFGALVFKDGLSPADFKNYPVQLEKLWQLNKKSGSYCEFYGWLKNYWGDTFYPKARSHKNVKTSFLGKVVFVGGELLLSGNNYSMSKEKEYKGEGLRVDTYNLHPGGFSEKAYPGNPEEYPVREYPANLTDYLFEDNSIAGNLAGIKSMFDMMNQFSLMAECTSRRLFQPPFIKSEFKLKKIGKLKFHYLRKRSIPKSPSILSEIQDDQVLDMFQGRESSLINQASCEDKLQAGGVNSIKNMMDSCKKERARVDNEIETEIDKKSFLKSKGREIHSLVHTTQQMAYDFGVWKEDVEQFEKLIKMVAKKPKKY